MSLYVPPLFPAEVIDKGGQVFNVKAYGAVCDGTTDDLAAWNAAIAAAGAAGVGTVFSPAPSAVSNTVVVNQPNVNVAMGYAAFLRYPNDGISGAYLCPTATFPTTGVPLLSYGVSGAGSAVPTNPAGGFLQNIGVSGYTKGGTQIAGLIGVAVNDTPDVKIQGGFFFGCAGYGLQLLSSVSAYGTLGPMLNACNFSSNGTHLYVDGTGATDGFISQCSFRLATTTGISLGATAASGGGYLVENCHFTSANTTQVNHILGTSTTGMVTFTDCYFDTISGGSHIQGLTKTQIVGCFFELSNSAGATQLAPVQIGGANPRVVFVGNYLETNGNTYVAGFVQFYNVSGFPDNSTVSNNIVRNGTGQPPASFLGTILNSSGTAIYTVTPAAQPLVSGTTYQNRYAQPMIVIQPVTLNALAGAAASASLSVGPTSGSLAVVDSTSVPATSLAGIIETVRARVPAGFYYSLTLTNSTAGTTQMVAEL